MDRSFAIKTNPALEPVGLEEQKLYSRIENAVEDQLLKTLISAARQQIEDIAGRAFIEQSWVLSFDSWPTDGRGVELPRPPLKSITEIRILDDDGNATAVDSGGYWADTNVEPAVVHLKPGVSLLPARDIRGIEIEYKAGYGADADTVPEMYKVALMFAANDLYESRRPVLSAAARAMLTSFEIIDL